jgi:hypothetical protein
MRRVATVLLAAVALAAAGCGDSPEDNAHDAGKDIGEELYDLRTAATPADAQEAAADIRQEIAELRSDLSPEVQERLASIGDDVRAGLETGDTPSGRTQVFANALAQLEALRSDSDSVVNELIRGVREGFADSG